MVTHLPSPILTFEVSPTVVLCCTLLQEPLAAFNTKREKEAVVFNTLHPSSQNLKQEEKEAALLSTVADDGASLF